MKSQKVKYPVFIIAAILLLAFLSTTAHAQDSIPVKEPSHGIDSTGSHIIDPGKAALYSAVFPGLGQIYNHKYWKLPIVYGALGGLVYAISFNHDQYKIYLNGFYSRIDANPNNDQFVNKYDERQLIELQNIYRRWRDLSVIITAVAYGLNVLDAYVDAHLYYYDISDDLTMSWHPAVIQNQITPTAFGLGVTISLK